MPDRQRLTQTLIDLIKIDSPTGEEDAIDAHLSNALPTSARSSGTTIMATWWRLCRDPTAPATRLR